MNKYNISFHNYSSVSDADLIQEITTLFPRCGEKSVTGRLRSSWYPCSKTTYL